MAGSANHHGERPEVRILKSGAKRTVLLIGPQTRAQERSTGEALRIVKRFHSPGLGGHRLLGAPGDRRRAAQEARALHRARATGLPVPSPGEVERSESGGWELSMTAVPGARTLSEVLSEALREAEPDPSWTQPRLRRLAERVGGLLRLVESAGFVHADPHPGNVILGADDELFIVDLARSRVGASPAPVRQSLVRALGRLRELCPRPFRRRIARAWLGPAATPEWSRRVESESAALRVEELRQRVRVWHRTSSATEVRAGLDGRGRAVWVRDRSGAAPAGWATKRVTGTRASTAQIWSTLVRAKLHGVPVCEPRALALTPPHAVEFDVPCGEAAPAPEAVHRAERRLARSGLRAQEGTDHDGAFVRGPDGTALLAHHAKLEACGLNDRA